jgi:hypothetical protein
MLEAIPPLPHTPSWRGAQLKKAQGQLYLYLKERDHREDLSVDESDGNGVCGCVWNGFIWLRTVTSGGFL